MVHHPTGTVTFLFSDIESSTRLWQEHPESMKGSLATHDQLMRSAIEGHGGYVFSTAGDAFAAAFSSVADAVSGALAAQLALGQTDWGEAVVRVRMGLHTGEAEERGGDYFGPALNRGARLMSAGHGGQVLLSSATAHIASGHLPRDVSLADLGTHRLKDLSTQEHIFQLRHPDLTEEFPALRTLDEAPNNLPLELTSFVGRQNEFSEIIRRLGEVRLLTLTGVGGVGKTRIALRVAAAVSDRYRDGVWFVGLADLSDPELIAKQVSVAMGIQEQADRSIETTLMEVAARRSVLLVLDNCEHLIEGVARLAEELLSSCPEVAILATSRERLGVSGETVWAVPPMPLPDVEIDPDPDVLGEFASICLFVDRAHRVDRQFSLTPENAAACAEVCRRLDGVPLAIELAAARVSSLSVQQIAERLNHRLSLLVTGARSALPRQQTLRAAIDWSYELLEGDEQKLFRYLSVFRGGFTMDAVEAVWSGGEKPVGDPLRLLTQLVDKSLVVVTSRTGNRRLGLLESIREYAWELLESAGEAEVALSRHQQWFTSWAATQGRLVSTPDQLEALASLEADHDNLRAVLERSVTSDDLEVAVRIAADISFFWWLHSHFGESGAWYKRLLAADDGVTPYVRAKLLIGAGEFSMSVSNHHQADERLSEALRIAQEIDAPRIEGWAQAYLMTNELWRLNLDDARTFAERSLANFTKIGDPLGVGYVTYMDAAIDYAELWISERLNHAAAEDLLSRLEPIKTAAEQFGELNLVGHLFDLLGPIALDAGHIQDAAEHLSKAVRAFDTLGNQICLAHALDHVAMLAVTSQPTAAVTLLAATTNLRLHLGVSARLAEQAACDKALGNARTTLEPDGFDRAWVEGSDMNRAQAVELASAITDAAAV